MSHSNCLKDVVNLIGHQAAIRLVRAKGGRDLKLPSSSGLSDSNWLVVLVGMANAIKLCDFFESRYLKLPIEVNALMQLRNEAIAEDYRNCMSVSQIATKYQIDRKLVQKVLDVFGLRGKVNAKEDVPQMNLI